MQHQKTIAADAVTPEAIAAAYAQRTADFRQSVHFLERSALRWPREVSATSTIRLHLARADLARAVEDEERFRVAVGLTAASAPAIETPMERTA
jgi:hypothetical protein